MTDLMIGGQKLSYAKVYRCSSRTLMERCMDATAKPMYKSETLPSAKQKRKDGLMYMRWWTME